MRNIKNNKKTYEYYQKIYTDTYKNGGEELLKARKIWINSLKEENDFHEDIEVRARQTLIRFSEIEDKMGIKSKQIERATDRQHRYEYYQKLFEYKDLQLSPQDQKLFGNPKKLSNQEEALFLLKREKGLRQQAAVDLDKTFLRIGDKTDEMIADLDDLADDHKKTLKKIGAYERKIFGAEKQSKKLPHTKKIIFISLMGALCGGILSASNSINKLSAASLGMLLGAIVGKVAQQVFAGKKETKELRYETGSY